MQNSIMKKVGITTTVPSEILYAAGVVPVDMNNLFITAEKYDEYIERAERDGFPKKHVCLDKRHLWCCTRP